MDFELSDEQRAFVELADDFARNELEPHAADWDRDHHFPVEVLQKAGGLGFCGLYTPEAAGGLGLSRLDASLIFERLSMGCTSTTAFLTIHNMV
ncbi:MAG: acyl-CoA dehydrogenase family protein, partial [Pseudomonas sp.]|nr:acyl-CoA dehydrogenase family protein [Pseudomonas sp.]